MIMSFTNIALAKFYAFVHKHFKLVLAMFNIQDTLVDEFLPKFAMYLSLHPSSWIMCDDEAFHRVVTIYTCFSPSAPQLRHISHAGCSISLSHYGAHV
jgi:hypothetical protein